MAHDLIEQDNVDTTLLIGGEITGTDDTERRVEKSQQQDSEIEEWEIVEAEVVLTDRATSDYVNMRITPAEGVDFPTRPSVKYDPDESPGGYLGRTFTLDVDNELRVDSPGPETTRLFTGTIANMTALGDYTYEAIAHDPSQEPFAATDSTRTTDFMNSTVNLAPATASEFSEELTESYYDNKKAPSGSRKILVSEIVTLILDKANIPEDRRIINLTSARSTTPGISAGETRDIEITFSEWEVPIEKALDRASKAANADWWFDRFGNFHFGPRRANVDINAYSLRYITDASDGKISPAYRSVRVIGDGVASEEGWRRSSMINEEPVSTADSVEELEEDGVELAEPTFVYRNMEINSITEAEQVKENILNDLKKQRGEGTVTIVGFPEIRPNDAIEMPNTERQPMGGERYAVEKVTHRLNTDNGFVTKVGVQGLGNPHEVLYEDDIEEPEEIESQWKNDNLLEVEGGVE